MKPAPSGFSLLEILLSLLLFAVLSGILLSCYQGMQRSSEAQWQVRQLWQTAFEYAEGTGQTLPESWQRRSATISCGPRVCIMLTVIDKQGRLAQLPARDCLASESAQEF